ncbi:hypothetical protein [Microbacterium gorillae]|uniref:hypothetical protein n=1 Tax=Microbacterium gorillae TaxID=1231063 RepID=UPI000693AF7D|nr:hypothetical protein [Microbacterium gorillae]
MTTITRLELSLSTACEQGAMCVHDRSGHGLSAIQLRLALATPSAWRDAVVTAVTADGWITLVAIADGTNVRVWHHADVSEDLAIGEPVALHARYDVLVAAGRHLNVAR